MSTMKELDLSIDEYARGNQNLRSELVEEVNEYLHGNKAFYDMSPHAQRVVEVYGTGNIEELVCCAGCC